MAILSNLVRELEEENDRLTAELAEAREWNHAVPVCKDHIELLVKTDGCVVCELAEALETSVEIRRNEDETLDEIVGKNVFVHLEQLDVDRWFLDIGGVILDLYHPSGGHVRAVILEQPDTIDAGKGE